MTEIDWNDVISAGDCGDVVASLRWRNSVRAHFITTSLGEIEVVVEGSPKDIACAIDNGESIPVEDAILSAWLAKSWALPDGTLPELLSVKVDGVEKLKGAHLDLLIIDEKPIPLDELAHQRRNARFLKDLEVRFPLDFSSLERGASVELSPVASPPICARCGSRMDEDGDGSWRCGNPIPCGLI